MSTEEIDTVIAYGPRDGKIILSARTESETQHLGRVLGVDGRMAEQEDTEVSQVVRYHILKFKNRLPLRAI